MSNSERLTFATQGDELSYHAEAARRLAGPDVDFDPKGKFGEVVRSSREGEPGLGVIAISTVAGTVEDSAKEIVRKRVSALPTVVARVDLPVKLALIGSESIPIEDLKGYLGVRLLGQQAAYLQCQGVIDDLIPHKKFMPRRESIEAAREALAAAAAPAREGKKKHPHLAIAPAHAAEPLGGVIIGPDQINPIGSITSFYALQRDPRSLMFEDDPAKTEHRTVISLAHPEGPGEFDKVLDLASDMGIEVGRFIPFDIGDFTKHDDTLRRGGGIFELSHDLYDPEMLEWFSRVVGLGANDGVRGPFDVNKLGGFMWYPGESKGLHELSAEHTERVAASKL